MTLTSVYIQLDLHEQVQYILLCPTSICKERVRAFSGCFIWLFKKIHLFNSKWRYGGSSFIALLCQSYNLSLPFWAFHGRVEKSLVMCFAQAIASYQNKWFRCSRKNTNTFIKLFYVFFLRQSTSPNMASMARSAIEDKFDAITSHYLLSYEWPQHVFLAISVQVMEHVSNLESECFATSALSGTYLWLEKGHDLKICYWNVQHKIPVIKKLIVARVLEC